MGVLGSGYVGKDYEGGMAVAEEREHAKEELGEGVIDDGEVGNALGRRESGEPLENGGAIGGWWWWVGGERRTSV